MAASFLKHSTWLIALLVPAWAQDLPIELDAASTDYDRRNQRLLFEQVSIARGALGISADRADSSQLDFADSTWVFNGNVRIRSADAEVSAQTATLRFVDHRLNEATIVGTPAVLRHSGEASVRVNASQAIVTFGEDDLDRITLTGTPAQFEHILSNERDVLTQGHANQVVYDVRQSQITLDGAAWVTQGENEIRGEEIAYDIEAQRVVAGGNGDGERVRITITPPAEADAPEDNPQ